MASLARPNLVGAWRAMLSPSNHRRSHLHARLEPCSVSPHEYDFVPPYLYTLATMAHATLQSVAQVLQCKRTMRPRVARISASGYVPSAQVGPEPVLGVSMSDMKLLTSNDDDDVEGQVTVSTKTYEQKGE
eukprot:2656805-Amphidinium_carterae.1